ncbi:tyrosine-protein phosphatase [Oenococcus alcoholitolerans]|uniref:tyrosine-protein phosphatase n=1 Tax=Oenococcus alcoholitolerans TaxID=931074 RepID=UPI003F716C0E
MDKRRLLPVKGGYNFRDIGGYTSANGQKIRWGKIFRTSSMSDLDDDDLAYLKKRDVDLVVDFRTKAEIKASPDRLLAGVDDISIPVMDFDRTESTIDYKQLNQEYEQKGIGYLKMISTYEHLISDHYSNMAYRKFFELLIDEKNTLVFHCTAGKDRTGIASMLLMGILNINEAQIKHDYLLTDRLSKDIVAQKMAEMHRQGADQAELENIHSMWTVNIDYLERALSTLKKISGSYENYFKEFLQIDQEGIDILRNKYLFTENAVDK